MSKIATLSQLVDHGLRLRAQIEAAEKELSQIEDCIVSYARHGEQIPLVDEDREGAQFLAAGTELVIPVVFTADKIQASFKKSAAPFEQIRCIAGAFITEFYRPETTYKMGPKDGKAFRKLASDLLGVAGPALVTACLARDKHGIPKSDIKIEWTRAFSKLP